MTIEGSAALAKGWLQSMLGQLAELPQGGRADPQHSAHFARSVRAAHLQALGLKQGVELPLGAGSDLKARGLVNASPALAERFSGAHP